MGKFLLLVFTLSFFLKTEKTCSYAGAQRNGVLLQEPVVQPSALGKTLGSSDAANGAKAEESVSQSALNGSGGPQETPGEEREDFPIFLQNQTAEDVTADCIIAHNKKRVGKLSNPLKPVKRDDRAADEALYSMHRASISGCSSKSLRAVGVGENLYATPSKEVTCEKAVGSWFSEIKNLGGKYRGKNWTSDAPHFTRLMWAKSTGIGCARTLACPNNQQVLACKYNPEGNTEGEAPFSEQVWKSIMQDLKSSLSSSPILRSSPTSPSVPQSSPTSPSTPESSPTSPSTSPIITSFTCVFIAVVSTVTSLSASLAY